MKWALVMMCVQGWNNQPAWCEPIQIFDAKAECAEVRNSLMESQPKESTFWRQRKEYACVPEKSDKSKDREGA